MNRLIAIIALLMLGSPLRAAQVTIDIKGGICGDCCTMKLFTKGVRNVIGANKGSSIVTLEYDSKITNPKKIAHDLKKVGKKVRVVSQVDDNAEQGHWVQPGRKTE